MQDLTPRYNRVPRSAFVIAACGFCGILIIMHMIVSNAVDDGSISIATIAFVCCVMVMIFLYTNHVYRVVSDNSMACYATLAQEQEKKFKMVIQTEERATQAARNHSLATAQATTVTRQHQLEQNATLLGAAADGE